MVPFPRVKMIRKYSRSLNGLKSKIPAGKRAIGDEGYVGNPQKITTRNSFDSDAVKKFKKRVKARHETFNGRLQAFGILNQPFRSTGPMPLEKHKTGFEACCVIVQYEIGNGHPLFKV
jgi:hypothetical protein